VPWGPRLVGVNLDLDGRGRNHNGGSGDNDGGRGDNDRRVATVSGRASQRVARVIFDNHAPREKACCAEGAEGGEPTSHGKESS
jgi:hypothetical protein